jgi:hypothetical protein
VGLWGTHQELREWNTQGERLAALAAFFAIVAEITGFREAVGGGAEAGSGLASALALAMAWGGMTLLIFAAIVAVVALQDAIPEERHGLEGIAAAIASKKRLCRVSARLLRYAVAAFLSVDTVEFTARIRAHPSVPLASEVVSAAVTIVGVAILLSPDVLRVRSWLRERGRARAAPGGPALEVRVCPGC